MLPLGHNNSITDALAQLNGWIGDTRGIRRTLRLDDGEHAALLERIKVVADALRLRPAVRRLDGFTQIQVRPAAGGTLTTDEITLAARVDAAYRTVTAARG